MRILLVDPDGAWRSVVEHWLTEFFAHVEIDAASSGAEALARLEKFRADLVIAAYPMPAPGGVELAAILKMRSSRPLSVAVSASCNAGMDLPGTAAGIDLWLEKRQLQARLLGFLQQRFPLDWARGVASRRARERPAYVR
jgi:CheY-like chemotaxis protein